MENLPILRGGYCSDGYCNSNAGENCSTCPQDCGNCPNGSSVATLEPISYGMNGMFFGGVTGEVAW